MHSFQGLSVTEEAVLILNVHIVESTLRPVTQQLIAPFQHTISPELKSAQVYRGPSYLGYSHFLFRDYM